MTLSESTWTLEARTRETNREKDQGNNKRSWKAGNKKIIVFDSVHFRIEKRHDRDLFVGVLSTVGAIWRCATGRNGQ